MVSLKPVEHMGGPGKAKLGKMLVVVVTGAGQKRLRGSGPENVQVVGGIGRHGAGGVVGAQAVDSELTSAVVVGTSAPVMYGWTQRLKGELT